MAKPKLALIPASQGSELFSVLPSSGVGDFNFSRSGKATRINSQGLIEEVANGQSRLEYPLIDGVVSGCPSLLLEPARTNLITYSEDFSQWINSNSSDLSNQIISPNGALNADKLITSSGLTNGQVVKVISKSASSITYNYSVFAKKGEWNRCNLYVSDTATFNNRVQFFVDLETGEVIEATSAGTFSSASGSSEYYGNGWYRFSVTFTTSTETSISARIYSIDSVATAGDGTSGIYIYGAQLEEGSYLTSYIPTNGAAVTRAAETANGSGDASTFNDSEGVLFADIKGGNDGTFNYISLSDGGTTNYVGILYTDTDNQIIYRYYVGGSGVQIVVNSVDVTNFNKISVKWKANDFAIWINGFELGTATSGSLNPSGTFNELAFARGGSNNTPFYGKTKQLQYFQTALTDSELETLTSWVSFTEMAIAQLYKIE